ncbi:Disease resistance protein [Corchorus capsularis]|uniref:Disease resistance protein n=1 Tax=Corchorus capsularis TaxID=210143 RepID=A0A1R3HWI8_COCAP|nr:Disease resistance protein [Corchorus capsularis]
MVRIVSAPVGKYFKYHRGVEKYMMILHKRLEELTSRKEDIDSRLNRDLHSSKTLKKEVKLWLESVGKITAEIDSMTQEVEERKYLSRARLGKKIAAKIKLVEEIHQKGDFADMLVIDAPPGHKDELPMTGLVGHSTARRNMEEVWNCLMGDHSYRKIGVYGIGGVGKTTIMKHIYNQLIKETDKFDHVIWISVSRSVSVTQLQDKVACALGVSVPENGSEVIRASKLFAMMRTMRKYVIILDDVWEDFQLEDVGIPQPTTDNGSKLVITTRFADVCSRMGCKEIKAELLTEEEAWVLFVEKAGSDVNSPQIKPIAKQVAKEGACLPLAIVTIARSMKGVTESCEWRNALEELRDSTRGHHDMRKVLEQLKFSYNHLDDEKLKHCLVYCALYPEDMDIGRKELIERLITGGVIDGMRSRQAEFDKGHAMLNKLEKACLLECVIDKRVKMHDLVRDMVLQVTGFSPHLMVKAGMHLRGIPNEEYWTDGLEIVSLMHNYISEIPSTASPICPKLSTLLISSNHCLTRIPDPFFVHLGTLQVLDLSDTSIEVVPNSISKLEKLSALLLRGCSRLRHVPSLGSLIALRKLDLCHARINELPQGMEMLINMKYLNLYTPHLGFFPLGILPKLMNLQVLLTYGASKTLKIKGEELATLRKLEIFSGQLYNVDDFSTFMASNSRQDRGPVLYSIRVGEHLRATLKEENELLGNDVILSKCVVEYDDQLVLPNDIQTLEILHCQGIKSLCKLFSWNNATGRLKSCLIFDCKDMECAFESTLPDSAFSNLKKLYFYECPNVKVLFTPNLLLQSLEDLRVSHCRQMEKIVGMEQEEEEGFVESNTKTFPMLKSLSVCHLPNLKTIFMGILRCDSLQVLEVIGCPNLKRLPFSSLLLPSSLDKILTTIEWWESLEWDHPNAKNAFQPFLRPELQRQITSWVF